MKNSKNQAVKVLEESKNIIWPVILKYLKDADYPKFLKIPSKRLEDVQYQWKIFKEYPERKGKYLRPTLVSLCAQAMGLPASKSFITAAAMQISEEWLLIHDDIEDDSLSRRKLPSLHKMYGIESALNAGDALQIIMWKILIDNFKNIDQKIAIKVMDEFYKMLLKTVIGQGVEIEWSKSDKWAYTDDECLFIIDGKTSYYTIAGPLRLGAILSGATAKQIEVITKFGVLLGRCFQIKDDLLDITSDYRGQSVGNDIYENKKTIILSHLVRHASISDRKKIIAILKKPREQKKQNEVNWIIFKMNQYKSIAYAENLAQGFKNKAKKVFEKKLKFLSQEPARSNLNTLIDFVVDRTH